MSLLTSPVCSIVSGAGRGIGKAICLALARELPAGSYMILLGRNHEQLIDTQTELCKINTDIGYAIDSMYECGNLDVDNLIEFMKGCRKGAMNCQHLLLIHNAGTVGEPDSSANVVTYKEAADYMQINFSAMIATNNVVLECFKDIARKTIVQVTSLAATSPIKSLCLYCAGKAARDMYFKVFAAENPDCRVLNYAPGPVDTDMFRKIKDRTYDEETQSAFQSLLKIYGHAPMRFCCITTYHSISTTSAVTLTGDEGITGIKPLDAATTCSKLIEILKVDKYESGQHVDYFDEIPK